MELKNAKIPNFDKNAFIGYFSVYIFFFFVVMVIPKIVFAVCSKKLTVLLPEHIKESKLETAVENVIGFRAYLTYHIKCAKAFFHSQMRARVKTMLQVLNRARYEPDDERKKKKIVVSAD
ncbi:hypothetical protein RFI_15016 [Reticulomyxa filosa]|uniref:Arp2/3 complex 34 kDa subunit n=1 Tax=Reticulomyxa filosa TaxID=46433 RepID=X6N7C0_RETFI|nr:hypothetical protein RFI_15016 [Reticulomyxa filosa]|eukprot:ETO22185.1 hypothetical protein RFI_15016 [Reticulomyxa filosa]